MAFLGFLRANLAGQTGIRVDAHWATQAATLEGMAQVALPDRVLREEEMADHLPGLARTVGHGGPAVPPALQPDAPFALADIYDDEMEALAAKVYQRDYVLFGFDRWG
jgi:hypothetical protein